MAAANKRQKKLGKTHQKRLWSAVEMLEKARDVAKDSDALFLLAEMNFVRPSDMVWRS